MEESIRLIFSYRVSSAKGKIRISPGRFLKETLERAVEFKARELPGRIIPTYGDYIVDSHFAVVHGEGVVPQQNNARITLRPHYGNVLGRCVALVTSSLPVVILHSDSDTAIFAKGWALADASKSEDKDLCVTLIS